MGYRFSYVTSYNFCWSLVYDGEFFWIIKFRIALILAHTTINLPLGLLIISSFMRDVPTEIQEAAFVDGCSNRQVYFNIILPLLRP